MAEDVGEKTEPASQRRMEQAVQKGQFAISRDLASTLILFVAIIGFQNFGMGMVSFSVQIIRYCLSEPWSDLDIPRVRIEMTKLAIVSAEALWPWTALVMLAALAANYAQTGGIHFASDKSYFDLERLNPLAGLQRIFSTRGLIKTVFDVAKVSVIGILAYMFLADRIPQLAMSTRLPFPELAAFAFSESLYFSYYMASVLLALAVADFLYQRFQFGEDMKMTKQEIKEEAKDFEGSPEIKSRRRTLQLQMARQRMMKDLPEAEVVITNPTELAVALKYKVGQMDAPVVVAMGAGVFARRIRELAAEYRIPIIENRPLAQLLFHHAEVGRVIPENTFLAVAEIMAYVYQLTRRAVPPRPR
ncbi:EscU/YscU/HrcU family type III secretion system export apparatus switch protein [bacterium]|nr:EscU/YscU/HrcU family type III secretion system export apparatus switch protein [bacterium]